MLIVYLRDLRERATLRLTEGAAAMQRGLLSCMSDLLQSVPATLEHARGEAHGERALHAAGEEGTTVSGHTRSIGPYGSRQAHEFDGAFALCPDDVPSFSVQVDQLAQPRIDSNR